MAFVVPADPEAPPTLEVLRDAVRPCSPPTARRAQLVLVDEVPRTALGKVRRRRASAASVTSGP